MAIRQPELKKLAMRSGGCCAFPECRKPLTVLDPSTGEVTVLGHVAHIVAQQDDGPRGDLRMDPKDRDRYENLVLLCTSHHQLVDAPANHATYTVERLRALRTDHEAWVLERLAPTSPAPVSPTRTDRIYSTLLPVERMARYLYAAATELRKPADAPDVQHGQYPLMVPFALWDGRLWAFQDLRDRAGPFAECVERGSTERHEVAELAGDPDSHRLVQQLLNRSLNKLTGRRGLRLDIAKHRYYFPPMRAGTERSEAYLSITGRSSRLAVAWQPLIRATGEKREFWLHRAVSLGFVQVDTDRWCLAVRPEFHVTTDGESPPESDKIGARITKKKSRMFNADLLTELQFWRHYLSDGQPRLVFKFSDAEAIHVSSTLMNGDVSWPGIPSEFDVNYTNVEYLDDLFTIGEVLALEDSADEWDDLIEPDDE